MNSQGDIKYCVCECGHRHRVTKRLIQAYKGLVLSLWRVFVWCMKNRRHAFEMNEVRDLLGKIDYARFGDWKFFGGLVHSPEKGRYELSLERCKEFFAGRLKIPLRAWKSPITGELEYEEAQSVHEAPKLSKLLNENGEYIAWYKSL